jgi:hypothetical protein
MNGPGKAVSAYLTLHSMRARAIIRHDVQSAARPAEASQPHRAEEELLCAGSRWPPSWSV